MLHHRGPDRLVVGHGHCCHLPTPCRLLAAVPTRVKRRKLFAPQAAEDEKHKEHPDEPAGESTESLFMKELRRRGYQKNDGTNQKSAGRSSRPSSATSAPDRPPSMREQRGERPPPSQLDISRQLNSEGLEGLPARASLLLRLGGSFFLGFVPFILVVALLFGGIYLFEGSNFIHGGRSSRMPEYINPDILLAEPGPDPRVPY